MAEPLPLALELPLEQLQAPGANAEPLPLPRPARPRLPVRRILVGAGIAVLVLGGAAVAAAVWLLPWYVRRECIEQAAAHGVALTVDDVSLDSTGFRLVNVHATSPALPGASIQAPEVQVETSGWQAQRLTVRRATIELKGRWSDVSAAYGKWRASGTGGAGGTWAPVALVVDESRVVWQGLFAENARVDASNTHLEIDWRASGTELHARSDAFALNVPAGGMGPWRVDVDRTPTMSRLRIALDPAVPDACTVLVVGDEEHTTSIDVTVPRSPPARLGLSPRLVGLEGNGLQVEASLHYAALGTRRADITGKGGLYGIQAKLPRPLDVTWDLSASGDPTAGLDVKKSHLTAGPLTGAMTGTLKAFDEGFRADLAWTGGPVPCSAFETPIGDGSPLDFALQLRQLADVTGVARVQGSVKGHGTLAFDSRDMGAARVQFAPDVSCQVSLFGQ
jgi:hypothetical protein